MYLLVKNCKQNRNHGKLFKMYFIKQTKIETFGIRSMNRLPYSLIDYLSGTECS